MTYTLIANNLANISHLEMVLSYAYYLCDAGHEVLLFSTFQKSLGGQEVLSSDILLQYQVPEKLRLKKGSEIGYDATNVILCNFGFIGLRNMVYAYRYKQFKFFVQMDEGSGSWQHFLTLLGIGIEEQKNRGKPWFLYSMKKLCSKLVGMTQFYRVYSWRWIKQDQVNDKLKKYLVKVYESKYYEKQLPFYQDETWIILTGGFVESGYISPAQYVTWLKELILKISTNTNHILLKAHPAENLSKYDPLLDKVKILEAKESIDSLMYNSKYHHYKVIGEYSTSLVTLNMLYGIKTYTIPSLVERKLTGQFKKLFEKHVQKFMGND